jgi:glycogen synthase
MGVCEVKVLVVTPEYPPNVIGGGGSVYLKLSEYLASRGHEVTTVFGNFANRNPFAGTRRSVGGDSKPTLVEAALLPTPRKLSWALSAMPPTLSAASSLLGDVLSEQWDVAHLHGFGFPLIDFCSWALRLRGVPYVFTIHGMPYSPFRRGPLLRLAATSYLRVATRRTVSGAAAITVVSSTLLGEAVFPISGAHVIPNGIDVADVQAAETPLPRRRGDVLRVLSVSRLSKNKGIDIAIRAAAMLRREARVEYDLYGPDGGDGAFFRRLVAALDAGGYIRFRGVFMPGERADVFQCYDALLMPSRVEPFGLAALEALAAGLPVIANPVGGLGDFLSESNALLVRSENPAEWADAISALDDVENCRARIVAGLGTARTFSWSAILPLYESELTRLAVASRAA